jgi:hypothetical protein
VEGVAMKTHGFNLIHKIDLVKQIESLIEAAKLANDEAGVRWLEILKRQYQ